MPINKTGAAALRPILDEQFASEQQAHSHMLEAMGRLAGSVAHDFNNVLTAIIGFSELLLLELPSDSESRRDALQIKTAADRASLLTKQLLAFSRRQIMCPILVDLNALIVDAEPLLRRAVDSRVHIRTVLEVPLPDVYADPSQLEQVLLNLVVNAGDAMPDGGVVTIETGVVTAGESYTARVEGMPPGQYICVSVSDTGQGMDCEMRNRIFEPYFTTKASGVGLGLSTVYGVVRQSDGHVWLNSERGVGTTFKVFLPAATRSTITASPCVALPDGGTETILIVEDETAVRDVARTMLQRRGYTVLVAADGEQAVRASAQFADRIDLLLTDVVLPHTNGRVVAEQVRAARPDISVLYMSGYSADTVLSQGFVAEGVQLLEKPFTESTLLSRVRKLLDARAAAPIHES